MCFMCFCVLFFTGLRSHHPCVLCVFVFFLPTTGPFTVKSATVDGSLCFLRSFVQRRHLLVGGATILAKLVPLFAPSASRIGVPYPLAILVSSFIVEIAVSISSSLRTKATRSFPTEGKSSSACFLNLKNSSTLSCLSSSKLGQSTLPWFPFSFHHQSLVRPLYGASPFPHYSFLPCSPRKS